MGGLHRGNDSIENEKECSPGGEGETAVFTEPEPDTVAARDLAQAREHEQKSGSNHHLLLGVPAILHCAPRDRREKGSWVELTHNRKARTLPLARSKMLLAFAPAEELHC